MARSITIVGSLLEHWINNTNLEGFGHTLLGVRIDASGTEATVAGERCLSTRPSLATRDNLPQPKRWAGSGLSISSSLTVL